MVVGPQAIGIGIDLFGDNGFGWSLGAFFAIYIALALRRLARTRSWTHKYDRNGA